MAIERPSQSPPWTPLGWRASDLALGLLLVLVGLGGLIGIGVALATVLDVGDPAEDAAAALLSAIIGFGFEVWLGVLVLLLALRRGITGTDFGFDAPHNWRLVSIGVLGAWTVILVYGIGLALIQEVTGADLGQFTEGNALPESSARTAAVWAALGLSIVVAAPLCEELFFRGFLFRAFDTLQGTRVAYVLSGLGFALFHFNVSVVLPFWVIGVLFAWIYRKSGAIWTPIAAHAIFNAVSFAVTIAGATS